MPGARVFTRSLDDALRYASTYPILINETDIEDQKTAEFGAIAGAQKVLTTANWEKHFTLTGWQRTTHMLNVKDAVVAGESVPCYFLPFLPNHSTTMTLGANCDWFFTSTLTGCTVQVVGPANAPTVTHANARDVYNAGVAATRPTNGGAMVPWDEITDTGKVHIDVTAAAHAQTTMNGLLPAAGGAVSGTLQRRTYVNQVTRANVQWGKDHFEGFEDGEQFGDNVAASKTTAGKYEVGVCFFGHRVAATGDWQFYHQTTVSIRGDFLKKHWFRRNERNGVYGNAIVLGAPTRLRLQ
ncbi:MAG: hypothetical protein AAF517_19500 [Planctomycetota bacterium]